MVTRRPRLERRAPSELAVSPLPREETTPPVTKTNFVGWELCRGPSSRIPCGRSTGDHRNTVVPLAPPAGGRAIRLVRRRREPHQQRHEQGRGGGRDGDAGVVDRRPDGQRERD